MKQISSSWMIYFIFLAFSPFFLQAQMGFSSGEIITVEGEKIKGFIGNLPFSELRKGFFFKENRKEKQGVWMTGERVEKFSFANDDTFIAHLLPAMVKEFESNTTSAFFHVLAQGKIQLLELNGTQSSPLFIQKGNGNIQLLCLSEIATEGFRLILYEALEKTISMEELSKLSLKRKSIQKLIENFNQGTPLQTIGDELIDYPRLSIGGFVGTRFLFEKIKYKGATKSFHAEIAPFSNRQISFSGSLQNFSGSTRGSYWYGAERRHVLHELNTQSWSVRANYYFIKKGFASPYVFMGIQETKGNKLTTTYLEEMQPEAKIKAMEREISTRDLLFGTGLAFLYDRHSLRLEFAKTKTDFSFRLGYQLALWK